MKKRPAKPEPIPLTGEQVRQRCKDFCARILNMGSAISSVDRQLLIALRRVMEVPGGASDFFIEALLQQIE